MFDAGAVGLARPCFPRIGADCRYAYDTAQCLVVGVLGDECAQQITYSTLTGPSLGFDDDEKANAIAKHRQSLHFCRTRSKIQGECDTALDDKAIGEQCRRWSKEKEPTKGFDEGLPSKSALQVSFAYQDHPRRPRLLRGESHPARPCPTRAGPSSRGLRNAGTIPPLASLASSMHPSVVPPGVA